MLARGILLLSLGGHLVQILPISIIKIQIWVFGVIGEHKRLINA